MSYFARLSNRERLWLIGTVVVAVGIVVLGWALEPPPEQLDASQFTTEMSIREIAPRLEVTGKSLARELDLRLDVPKKKPLKQLNVEQEKLDHAVAHVLSHRATRLKYYVFGAIVLFGLVFLTRLGRPDGSPASERKTWYPRAPYVIALLLAVAVCGFLLGKSPNPMEGVVKVFKSMVGLYPSVTAKVIAFIFFLALAIVGDKLVCGWACPFGASQELLYSLPVLERIKRRKVPFWASNAIRGGLFVVMLLLLFGIVGGREGFVVYHFLNPFNLFNLDFETLSILLTVVIALVLSLAVYRPFCQFICPFGYVSWLAEVVDVYRCVFVCLFGFFPWLAERLSLPRVRIDREACTECGACVRACPSEAAKHKVEGKRFGADCYSCARCLNVCPVDAIQYRFALGSLPSSALRAEITAGGPEEAGASTDHG